jgi:NADPH:quinone reductase-like Zn-dependent oxidoreductase
MLPLPGTPGMEASGTVLDVGEGVTALMPGDRVAYMGPVAGAYTTVRTVPQDWVVRLPAAVEDDVAAALLLKGVTADYLLRDLGRVQPGARWLVHAAAGGVGLLLCGWARRLGARVVGTVSSPEKARVAREHGCEHVIVTPDYRFADSVRHHFGDGADVIVDGLGDAAREENFAALAPCGHWISLGQASGALQPISPDLLVIDVREAEERGRGYIPGSIGLSRGTLERDIAARAFDGSVGESELGRPIVVYCAGGARSVLAAASLRSMGFTNVQSLEGGFGAWGKSGQPVEHPRSH